MNASTNWFVAMAVMIAVAAGSWMGSTCWAAAYSPWVTSEHVPDSSSLEAFRNYPAWRDKTGQELAIFPGHTGMVNGLAFSPDGSRLASSSVDGTTRVYAVDVEELIALAQSRLTRWWTPEECQQYLHEASCPDGP